MTVENAVSVIVSRPPSDVHIEVDGIAASTLTLDFRQSKSKKVTTSRETERLNFKPISCLLVLSQIYFESVPAKLPPLGPDFTLVADGTFNTQTEIFTFYSVPVYQTDIQTNEANDTHHLIDSPFPSNPCGACGEADCQLLVITNQLKIRRNQKRF